MKITIYRGTREIGGTLMELRTDSTRILIDAGYPLFLNGSPIDSKVSKMAYDKLLELGVLPKIDGLYTWDRSEFDAVVISHAHLDHYGLLRFINPSIPVYLSGGTRKIIEISQLFRIADVFSLPIKNFNMYEDFRIGEFTITPYLMDHSAFDAAAFEISAEGKTIIYTGDFRGHGRKGVCLERFISHATKEADILLTEGTMFGRTEETVMTEDDLENAIVSEVGDCNAPVLFQSSSQNIDRLVSFYKASKRLGRTFVVDVYTANVLHELRQLGNQLPYPSREYADIKVFFPYSLTQKIFNEIGEGYARRFSEFHISREHLKENQHKIVMAVRPSMLKDIEKCGFKDGVFLYSLWQGYRDTPYQQKFEDYLSGIGFETKHLHTSGHASITDLRKVIEGLHAKKVIPVHTMYPDAFRSVSNLIDMKQDGVSFEI